MSGDSPWCSREVHVWHYGLTGVPIPELNAGVLSLDERLRAERMRSRDSAETFLVARMMLRRVLGQYLGCAPVQVVVHYTAAGKPYITGSDLKFNVSHAAGAGLIAVARQSEIGVDIERIDHTIEWQRLAVRLFGSDAGFSTRDEVYQAWTEHESYAKARGRAPIFTREPPESGWFVKPIRGLPRDYAGGLASLGECSHTLRELC